MLDKLKKRLDEINKALEHSAANHNGLLGARQELMRSIHELENPAPEVEQAEVIKEV